jgi:hypothetical protein
MAENEQNNRRHDDMKALPPRLEQALDVLRNALLRQARLAATKKKPPAAKKRPDLQIVRKRGDA